MNVSLWTCVATCKICGKELNRAEHVPEKSKSCVIISAPIACLCDVPEHNTSSDCNIGVVLEWEAEDFTCPQ